MKITKAKLKQIIKEELSTLSEHGDWFDEEGSAEFEGVRNNLLGAIPENYDVRKFAKNVASIILSEYGDHNIPLFLEAFNQELPTKEVE